jgi:hypothetical protein
MRSLLVSAISLLFASSLVAQTASTIDAKAILQSLQDIQQKQTTSAKSQLLTTINDFTAASSDDGAALNFYVEAVRVTRFVGQLREDVAFAEWKKNSLPTLNPGAIRIALRYTTITLQRAAGATDDQIFPVLFAYVQQVQDALPGIYAQAAAQRDAARDARPRNGGREMGQRDPETDILQQPVSDNIFARWYNIGGKLAAIGGWELVPSNLDSMYQQILLPIMRKRRDPRVIQYWDAKILAEKAQASTATAAFSTDRFNLTRRPSLLWSRAEDEVVIGERDQGITDMYDLVKTFPAHPEAAKWIKELQGLLTTPPAAPPAGT